MSQWSNKMVPVQTMVSGWGVTPPDADRYTVIDETEADLDTANYIYFTWVGIPEFRLAVPSGLPPLLTVEEIQAVTCYKWLSGVGATVAVIIDGAEYRCGSVGPLKSSPTWAMTAQQPQPNVIVPATAFDDWRIRFGIGQNDTFIYACYVRIKWVAAGTIATDANLFGQHFRLFDDGGVDDISFEQCDHPAAPWSSPTQPFPGNQNRSPDIECLSTGCLRAAYLDSDGVLQQALSTDDGESWEVV